jgi:phospholipid/cholesterol/gamma-HCH transport system ATP-binding protein
LITIDGISKSFRPTGGGPPNQVLRRVSFEVPKGCLYGLIGPGAAGKSILLKLITGLMKPDAGRIVVDGEDVTAASELELQKMRLKFGMLFQNNALFDHMTVGDNIAFPLRRLTSLGDEEIRERVSERLQCVALAGFETRMPAGLSGGQKKRVGVARATITRSPIVLYDEPAAGLDPVTSQKIFELLRAEQRASGATVLMVSSDLDRLLPVTDRIGMMYRGELIFDGTTEQARSSTEPRVRQFVHGLTEGPL